MTRPAFTTVQAGLFTIGNCFVARDLNLPAFDLDIYVFASNPWQLGDSHEVIALAKNIDRRKGATATYAAPEPITGTRGVKVSLKIEKSFEGV